MKTVSAREANQSFSALLRRVSEGEEVVITKRGEPVARLIGVGHDGAESVRKAAQQRLLKVLRKGRRLGGAMPPRDVLHER